MWTEKTKKLVKDLIISYRRELMDRGYFVLPIRHIRFSKAYSYYGLCETGDNDKTVDISISHICLIAGMEEVKSTILHELIHAMPCTHGHDATWKQIAKEISKIYNIPITTGYGDKPSEKVLQAERKASKYIVKCISCNHKWFYQRKTRTVQGIMKNPRFCTCPYCHKNEFKVLTN